MDLIPDGIEDLGYIDDAFVFRVASAAALKADAKLADAEGGATVKRLAEDADTIRTFLGDDYARLERFVAALSTGAARGRSVDDILAKDDVCSELISELKGWADSYEAPNFTRDEEELGKAALLFGSQVA